MMNFNFVTWLFAAAVLLTSGAFANNSLREVMSDMRHEISNHEVEIRILEEKFNNQQIAIESLRQRLIEAGLDQKDLLKGNSAKDNIRISNLESSVKSAVSDLHKLQIHANDTTKTLSQYKKKMQELFT